MSLCYPEYTENSALAVTLLTVILYLLYGPIYWGGGEERRVDCKNAYLMMVGHVTQAQCY